MCSLICQSSYSEWIANLVSYKSAVGYVRFLNAVIGEIMALGCSSCMRLYALYWYLNEFLTFWTFHVLAC